MLKRLKDLNSDCFLYENYESGWWTYLDLTFNEALETRNIRDCIKKYAIGYCDGSKVRIRPRPKTYAVMFEKDGIKFWFHIEKWQADEDDLDIQ